MTERELAKLRAIYQPYFMSPPIPVRFDVEAMYQAFKARIMAETKVHGGSCEGVVYGNLEDK